MEDFSCEHLGIQSTRVLKGTMKVMNDFREEFLKDHEKDNWWQMIQLLPSSYNQKRTVMLNYEVLANIYKSRRNHKLDEWSVGFMEWIESLPYSELICGPEFLLYQSNPRCYRDSERRCGMSKHDISKGVPITDIRVLPITFTKTTM